MDLEIFCDIAPRTCTNFIGLVEAGKYNGSCAHRLIPNFMVQMGKPSGKDEKETSLWGEPFVDEFDDRLKHDKPGVVSMANAGPGTNHRQFFITFRSTPHLDRKHSVFGRVVTGMDVLSKIEHVPTDDVDRPSETVKIIQATLIGSNPVQEAQAIESNRIQQRKMEKLQNTKR
jgi:peptidyl-prolyl cis-trans isomerase-like protein 2